jgi:hypothetical protein
MPVATQNPAQRRTLQFESIDQILAELEVLAAAEKEGKLRALGTWTAGQNLGHLASWIDYSYDGVPFKVPFIARIIMRPMKKRFLFKPMKPGSRIPKVPGGTVGIDVIPFDEGISKFRNNLNRLKAKPPEIPHALFGPLTHEEWIAQHLRHAELHLSFLRTD